MSSSNLYAVREEKTRSLRPGDTVYVHGKAGRVFSTDSLKCKVVVEHEAGSLFSYDVDNVSRELPATALPETLDTPQVSDLQDRIERLEATVRRVELRLLAIEALQDDEKETP